MPTSGLTFLSKLPSIPTVLLLASSIAGVNGCTCPSSYPICIFSGPKDNWCKGRPGNDEWCTVAWPGTCIFSQCGASAGNNCNAHHSSYTAPASSTTPPALPSPPTPPSPPPPLPPPPSPPTWRRSQTAEKRLSDAKIGKAPSCMLRVSATPSERRAPPYSSRPC